MSRVKLLLDVIDGLRSLADDLQALSDALSGEESAVPEKAQTPSPPEEAPVTLEAVRAALAKKSRSGYTAEVKELISRHGAGRLSDVNPTEYAALLAEAEAIGNGG